LGFIVVEPRCAGDCEVRLQWDAGWEPRIALALALLAIAAGGVICFRRPSRDRKEA